MTKNGWRRALLVSAIGALLGMLPGSARAAGFQLFEQNASGLGNAYAGQAAAAEDASTIYFNPAGLTRLPRGQVVGALHLVKPSSTFSNNGSCTPYVGTGVGTSTCPFGPNGNLGHVAGGTGGDAGDWSVVPNAYLSWEVLPSTGWLGLGVNAPFGLTTAWDADWVGRFQAIKSEVQTININPTVAWKINHIFSVGAGVSAQRLDTELTQAVSYRAVALATGIGAIMAGTPAGAEGVLKLSADDWAWGWNVGVMAQVSPAMRLGVSYRSRLTFTVKGEATFGNRPAALSVVPNVADGTVKADITLPDTLSVAVAYQWLPQLQLLADYTWTRWDAIQDLTVVRTSGPLSGQMLTRVALRFKNSWRVGLGANYQLTPQWKLRGGFAFDQAPVPDAFRTPRLPDEDRTWLAAGAQWAFAPHTALDFGLAYLFVKDASSNLVNQETATSVPRGSLVGNYETNVWILSAQIRRSF
jgi:long-chain fatty acid transport protein